METVERTALKAVGSQIVENGESIAVVWYDGTPEGFEKAKARAALIVRAVNSFPAMKAALEKIIEMNIQYAIDKYGDASHAESMACVRAARAALTEATGGAPLSPLTKEE